MHVSMAFWMTETVIYASPSLLEMPLKKMAPGVVVTRIPKADLARDETGTHEESRNDAHRGWQTTVWRVRQRHEGCPTRLDNGTSGTKWAN